MKKPSVGFFGLGYVGLTTASCLAARGFKTIGFDVDKKKVEAISRGQAPFFEPGLTELIKENLESGGFKVTTDPSEAVMGSDVSFITVGTPQTEDRTIDLTYVESASKMIGRALRQKNHWHVVVVKSTVVPTTTEKLVKPVLEQSSGKRCPEDFGLCMNPEFLREGNAVADTQRPDRVIIGEVDRRSGDSLESLYKDFYGGMPTLVRTTPVNAELAKYANNAFLAVKISFINEIANLCQKLPRADVEVIAKSIGLDNRIGRGFLKAGLGWGGSCFPKDLSAIIDFARNLNADLSITRVAFEVNENQPIKAVELAESLLGALKEKKVAILGLSFKPNTDDIRDAVSVKIIRELIRRGSDVVAYDPAAIENARSTLNERVHYATSVRDCLKNAECCIIVTEWDEFTKLSEKDFTSNMKTPIVIDGRRIYDPKKLESHVKFAALGLGK